VAILELKNITRSYRLARAKEDLKILKGINLTIEEGEFVAIRGPSGSGKSTLMQIMGLLDRPTSGVLRLAGWDASALSDDEGAHLRSQTIGFIFQMFNLLARTSALDNVLLPMLYSTTPHRMERARELLTDMGLADRMGHKPNELSGGQQQRVAIARALANRPKILFADEPTGNLASDQAEEILQKLERLNRSGLTVILVTHEAEIAAHARRVIKIKDGQIVSDERNDVSSPAKLPSRLLEEPAPSPRFRLTQIKEYATTALRALGTNKARSALSVLGILIGVAAVIAMLAVGTGAQKAIEARLASLGSNLLMIRPERPQMGGVRGAAGSVSRLTETDVNLLAGIPHVLRVEGNVRGTAQVVYGDKNSNIEVTGATPLYAPMRNAKPYYGRFFTDTENESQARVALLGQTTVNTLFGTENPLDKFIKIDRLNFKVIGILPMKGSSPFRDQDDVALIPLRTAMRRAFGTLYYSHIALECDSPESIPQVMEEARRLMRRAHRLPEYKDDDFNIRNMADIQAALSGTTQTFTLLLGIVAAISLLVGGIGIMNIMLVSVTERTREIGLRKAVGAPRRAILSQFLIESATLSTLGGVMGIALGTTVSLLLSTFAGWAAPVSLSSILLAFIFSVTVGIVFGFWPARKASLLSPIEALRYE
jgi:macrolide transport system ATP-binding/permease protein